MGTTVYDSRHQSTSERQNNQHVAICSVDKEQMKIGPRREKSKYEEEDPAVESPEIKTSKKRKKDFSPDSPPVPPVSGLLSESGLSSPIVTPPLKGKKSNADATNATVGSRDSCSDRSRSVSVSWHIMV